MAGNNIYKITGEKYTSSYNSLSDPWELASFYSRQSHQTWGHRNVNQHGKQPDSDDYLTKLTGRSEYKKSPSEQ